VLALDLGEVLDAAEARHPEVDRLPRGVGERAHGALGQFHEVAPDEASAGEAQHHRAGAEAPALSLLLHEAVALERVQESRRRALRQAGVGGQICQPAGGVRLEHEREKLGPTIDHGRARGRLELLFHARYIRPAAARASRRERVHERDAPLRDPLRRGDGDA
jgi:hypothetical protein